jgi:hypothetical protein
MKKVLEALSETKMTFCECEMKKKKCCKKYKTKGDPCKKCPKFG